MEEEEEEEEEEDKEERWVKKRIAWGGGVPAVCDPW